MAEEIKEDEQNKQPNNAGLQHKLSDKQAISDTDKAGMSKAEKDLQGPDRDDASERDATPSDE